GPDVLVLDGMPAEACARARLLLDLNTALPELKEALQPNILACYMRGDSVYMLPVRFMISMICTSGQKEEIFGSLEALVDYCREQEGNAAVPAGMSWSCLLELLYYNFLPGFEAGNFLPGSGAENFSSGFGMENFPPDLTAEDRR
ncbi:MAG: hypothetical protein K2N94_10235, partial [Lachnospiraceae bacterium]|nr:hypothetical protein [Lachnospiraceae bacterium]